MSVLSLVRPPDLVSLLNLLFGVSSIYAAHSGQFDFALILLLLAAASDGADGYVARKFNGGVLGEHMDSLADVVSFGVAPAILLNFYFGGHPLTIVVSYLYAICGTLRLARFNALPAPKKRFEGLPITAGCAVLASYLLLDKSFIRLDFLLVLTVALSLLMISTVSYPKIRNVKAMVLIASIFGAAILLFFVNLQYLKLFSPVLFGLMMMYLLSPLLKVPSRYYE